MSIAHDTLTSTCKFYRAGEWQKLFWYEIVLKDLPLLHAIVQEWMSGPGMTGGSVANSFDFGAVEVHFLELLLLNHAWIRVWNGSGITICIPIVSELPNRSRSQLPKMIFKCQRLPIFGTVTALNEVLLLVLPLSTRCSEELDLFSILNRTGDNVPLPYVLLLCCQLADCSCVDIEHPLFSFRLRTVKVIYIRGKRVFECSSPSSGVILYSELRHFTFQMTSCWCPALRYYRLCHGRAWCNALVHDHKSFSVGGPTISTPGTRESKKVD